MDREQLIKQMTDYVINVLEERRPEFSGFAVCPFVKADRLANQLHLDVFDNTKDTLVDVVLRFVRSGKRSALIAQPNESIKAKETNGYQDFINLVLEESGNGDIGALCFNPNNKVEVMGYDPLSTAPCFLINMARHKDLAKARTALLRTSYYDKLPANYKKYLNVK
tara:strand:- start:285 stop:782 length:498 start_codon:yes stop_codon:yes gene_type:complete